MLLDIQRVQRWHDSGGCSDYPWIWQIGTTPNPMNNSELIEILLDLDRVLGSEGQLGARAL